MNTGIETLLAATETWREQEAENRLLQLRSDPAWTAEEEARIASESWRHTSEAVHRKIKQALVDAFGVGTHLNDVDHGLIEEIIYDVCYADLDHSDNHVNATGRRCAAVTAQTWAGRLLTEWAH